MWASIRPATVGRQIPRAHRWLRERTYVSPPCKEVRDAVDRMYRTDIEEQGSRHPFLADGDSSTELYDEIVAPVTDAA